MTTAGIYHGIPPGTRVHTAIYCANYGEASAIGFFRPRYGLPRAVCAHQNFYVWGPGDAKRGSVLAIGFSRKQLERNFSWVETAKVLDNPYAMPYENGPIFYCCGPNAPVFCKSWTKLRNRH